MAYVERCRFRRTHDTLAETLNGRVRDHNRLLLRCLLAQVDRLNTVMAEVCAGIERRIDP